MPPPITVIIPAYEEEARLGATLDRLIEHPLIGGAEIIVVDDGSRDSTYAVAQSRLLGRPMSRTIRIIINKGKGGALREGAAAARGEKVLFMDADLATSLDAVAPMLDRLDEADVVVGSRTMEGSVVTGRTRGRSMMHRAFSAQARQLTGLGVSDPQCGFKGFRREVAKALFEDSRLNGFSIDVELLLIAQNRGLRIDEIPVRWHAMDGSKVRPLRDPFTMAADVARVRYRHRTAKVVPA